MCSYKSKLISVLHINDMKIAHVLDKKSWFIQMNTSILIEDNKLKELLNHVFQNYSKLATNDILINAIKDNKYQGRK